MPKKILVVDDEPVWRRILRGLLTYHGYEVIIAASCEEGLTAVKQNSIDGAVVDFDLKDGWGDLICAAIREKDSGIKTPVILFTADPAAEAFLVGPHRANLVVYKDSPLKELPGILKKLF